MAESNIDISIANIWRAWQAFSNGKRSSLALQNFRIDLEGKLLQIHQQLSNKTYRHGGYAPFVVHDPKRREIAVADVADRIVHRLMYDYLVRVWDPSFCYDAWSCRRGKGLQGAINRAQSHSKKYRRGWLWRSDITKFFDTINQDHLKFLLSTKLPSQKTTWLLNEVISSYTLTEVRSQKSEVRSQKSEVRSQKSEVRSQKSEVLSFST